MSPGSPHSSGFGASTALLCGAEEDAALVEKVLVMGELGQNSDGREGSRRGMGTFEPGAGRDGGQELSSCE
jgi:hypothetical protein